MRPASVALMFLALGCGLCLAGGDDAVRFKVYDEHEFLVTVPGATAVTGISLLPSDDGTAEDEGETSFAVNGDEIWAWGSRYKLVKGGHIAYTIDYKDGKGAHQESGVYEFDGEYDLEPKRKDLTTRSADETYEVTEDVDEDEEQTVDEEDGPVFESRFGGFGGRRHRGRRRHHLRHPPPPFGPPHGPGVPHYPYSGGPERYPPHHRPPFHHGDEDFGHGPHHRGRGSHAHCHDDQSEERHPHGGRPTPRPDSSTEKRPRVETTTPYTPDIDIRFQDD